MGFGTCFVLLLTKRKCGRSVFATSWTIALQAPPSSHGIFQARVLEWVAIPFSRASSWPRDWTRVSCIRSEFFTIEPWGKPSLVLVVEYIFLIWLCVLLQHLIFWCKLNSRGEKWGGMNWDIGVETYILPWIDNYWDNYLRTCCIPQCFVVTQMGRKSKKLGQCVYM